MFRRADGLGVTVGVVMVGTPAPPAGLTAEVLGVLKFSRERRKPSLRPVPKPSAAISSTSLIAPPVVQYNGGGHHSSSHAKNHLRKRKQIITDMSQHFWKCDVVVVVVLFQLSIRCKW